MKDNSKINGVEMMGNRYPKKTIREVVAVIKERELRISEAAKMFNINHHTVRSWLMKDSPELFKAVRNKKTISEKKAIVREVQAGLISVRDAAVKYNAGKSAIREWLQLYSYQITDMKKDVPKPVAPPDKEKDKLIKELQLKVMALETLIDVAEDTFKIDIRKKSGTKQP